PVRDDDGGEEDRGQTGGETIWAALRELDCIIARVEAASARKRLFYGSSRLGVIRIRPYKNTIFLRRPFWRDSSKLMERFFTRLEWFEKRMEAQSGLMPRTGKRGQSPKDSPHFSRDEFELISKKK
ncbi:MAG: hypothetical protein FJ088_04550, partial [Deltaproteobacteria bacterium]|nr:hypothetical protein [Deltaproteobacteria bacterium]